jgi:hypothetical protein
MPAALMGAAFFSISLSTKRARYSVDYATMAAPTSLRRPCTDGVSMTSTFG